MLEYYVYLYFRMDGTPLYVGKGKGDRINNGNRNVYFQRLWSRRLPRVILNSGLDEPTAYEYEIAWIAAIGRLGNGGPLVNMTDGGEGVTFTDEIRLRMSRSQIGKRQSAEQLAKKVAAHRGRKNSAETILRMRAAALARVKREGIKPVSGETRRKLSEAGKGRQYSGETKQVLREKKAAWWSAHPEKRIYADLIRARKAARLNCAPP